MLPENYRPAPRETPADESGDASTKDRKLKDRIYLTETDGDRATFPTTDIKEDESLLEAAQRLLKKKAKALDVYCPSHAPIGVQLSVEDADDTYFGTKTFFVKVQHDDGDVGGKNFSWLDRDEVVEQVHDDDANFYRYLL